MKVKLASIILFVQDIEILKGFYIDMLGMRILEEYPGQWLLLDAGGCEIGLHKIGEEYLKESSDKDAGETNTKIVFEIEEDIHAIRQQLIAKQIVVQEVKTFDQYDFWICDGEDPEGNVFQLRQRK